MKGSHASESAARRAAKRLGYRAVKSRWRLDTVDNWGGFAIVDPETNGIVAGSRFSMTADDVIQWCKGE